MNFICFDFSQAQFSSELAISTRCGKHPLYTNCTLNSPLIWSFVMINSNGFNYHKRILKLSSYDCIPENKVTITL